MSRLTLSATFTDKYTAIDAAKIHCQIIALKSADSFKPLNALCICSDLSAALKKAADNDINVWSMDDAKIYGREFYRLNFGEAVKISGTINAPAKKMTHGSAALVSSKCYIVGTMSTHERAKKFLCSKIRPLTEIYVQAVGRVMRKAPDKRCGYAIIPVIVPLDKNLKLFCRKEIFCTSLSKSNLGNDFFSAA